MLLLYRGESFDANFFYHAGVDMDHAFLLAGKSRILFVPLLNESFARSQFKGKVIAYRNPFAELEKHIKGKTVYADFSSLSAKMVMRLRRICKLKDHSAELMEKRMRKRKDEVSDIRKAVSLTKELISSLDLKSAKTELDLEKQIIFDQKEKELE